MKGGIFDLSFRQSIQWIKYLGCVGVVLLALQGCKTPRTAQRGARVKNEAAAPMSRFWEEHSEGAVDWQPWSEQTLADAAEKGQLLVVSIGYSACHWCTRMAHEAFADTTVGRLMNTRYTSILVDREMRPDIDDLYMMACQLASDKGCGWPLNVIALPDGRPIWAGTYFPTSDWKKVLNYFIDLQASEPDKLLKVAEELTIGIQNANILRVPTTSARLHVDSLMPLVTQLIDLETTSRSASLRFPRPVIWSFLLEHTYLSANAAGQASVLRQLDAIAAGGIRDHVGGGFSRYAKDSTWHVPHFEKMLYDNTQLATLYLQAYKITGEDRYADIARQTLLFLQSELRMSDGGYASSLSADVDGEEGAFYTWTLDEVKQALATMPDALDIFCDYYDITAQGNWKDKKNILHTRKTYEEVAMAHNTDTRNVKRITAHGVSMLQAMRSSRVSPYADDKRITAWNAMAIKSFIHAYTALHETDYLDEARRIAKFVEAKLRRKDGGLYRSYRNGAPSTAAFLDDYAYLIDAYITLYQATFEEEWLNKALQLQSYTLEYFYDPVTDLFFYTDKNNKPLISRKREVIDNVIASSNSVMAKNLFRLGAYYFELEQQAIARNMLQVMYNVIAETEQPQFYANWLSLYAMLATPPYEIAIVGDNFDQLKRELEAHYLPNVLLLGGKTEGSLLLLEGKLIKGETTIYVCKHKMCKAPVSSVSDALEQLQE